MARQEQARRQRRVQSFSYPRFFCGARTTTTTTTTNQNNARGEKDQAVVKEGALVVQYGSLTVCVTNNTQGGAKVRHDTNNNTTVMKHGQER